MNERVLGSWSGESDRGGGAGLVLGGGGARGAYASGALSVLLRELKDQVRVIVGTSAGALISAYLAANWHRPAEEAIEDGLQLLARAAIRGRVRAADGAWRGGSVHALRQRVSAGQQPARPVDAAPRTAGSRRSDRLVDFDQLQREHPRAAGGARGGRYPRAQQRIGRLSPGRDRATPRRPAARDRVRRDPRPRRRAYPGLLGDPGAVPGRARDDARAGGRLVLRRWPAPEHADQAGAVAGGRARDRDRAQFRRPEPHATARPPARLLRRGRAPAARRAGRPAGPGHPHAGQQKRADRGPARRRGSDVLAPALLRASAPARPAGWTSRSSPCPTSSSRPRTPRRSARSPDASTASTTGAPGKPARAICGCWERSSTAVPTPCTASS